MSEQQSNSRLDTIRPALDELRRAGWEPGLTPESYDRIAQVGFYRKTLPLAFVATEILATEQPMTLRGLFYRVVSAGWLPSTERRHYDQLGRIMVRLREAGVVPFAWLVDHVRSTIKPSSWSGLTDFADTVRDAYRMDFWSRLPAYVHVFVEKDAMAGVLAPVTEEYDVSLSVVRGFVSVSFAYEIGELWSRIEKPIFAYYLGDHDPSGLDLERDLREKLGRYCLLTEVGTPRFLWKRLAVVPEDFSAFDLFPLTPKQTDSRTRWFLDQGHEECAELDAIPAGTLRDRLRAAIESHIPRREWKRLQQIERLERQQWHEVLGKLGNGAQPA